MNIARLGLYFTSIAFVLVLDWVHSFVLELVVVSYRVWYMQGGMHWT